MCNFDLREIVEENLNKNFVFFTGFIQKIYIR